MSWVPIGNEGHLCKICANELGTRLAFCNIHEETGEMEV